jgi:hypothetical protein
MASTDHHDDYLQRIKIHCTRVAISLNLAQTVAAEIAHPTVLYIHES